MNYNIELSGKRIAELRSKAGISQAKLSELPTGYVYLSQENLTKTVQRNILKWNL